MYACSLVPSQPCTHKATLHLYTFSMLHTPPPYKGTIYMPDVLTIRETIPKLRFSWGYGAVHGGVVVEIVAGAVQQDTECLHGQPLLELLLECHIGPVRKCWTSCK